MQEFLFKYITKGLAVFAIGCLLISTSQAQELDSLAQNQSDSVSLATQTTAVEPIDSIEIAEVYPLLSDVSILLDYGKLMLIASDFESKMEAGIELGIKNNFFITAEYGQSQLAPNAYTNTNYKVEGNYYRIGLGYKRAMSAKTNMGLSLRYAAANYQDEGVIKIESTSELFDEVDEPFARENLSANWYELVFNSESELMSNLYLGFNFRVRFMSSYDKQSPIDTYAIPGYGRTFDKSVPALNLYIKYKLNFK